MTLTFLRDCQGIYALINQPFVVQWSLAVKAKSQQRDVDLDWLYELVSIFDGSHQQLKEHNSHVLVFILTSVLITAVL